MAYSTLKSESIREEEEGIGSVIIAILALVTVLALGYGLLEHIRYKEALATIASSQSAPASLQVADSSSNDATSPGTGTGGESNNASSGASTSGGTASGAATR